MDFVVTFIFSGSSVSAVTCLPLPFLMEGANSPATVSFGASLWFLGSRANLVLNVVFLLLFTIVVVPWLFMGCGDGLGYLLFEGASLRGTGQFVFCGDVRAEPLRPSFVAHSAIS